jgi:prepilin-type N-terminal cleavage/methylation domain-containing protein
MLLERSKIMKRLFKNNRGFSLIEIMISAGVLGIMVTALSSYLVSTTQGLSRAEKKAVLNVIYEGVRVTATTPSALAYSVNNGILGNRVISNCVNPVKSCPSQATNSRKQDTFNLYDSSGTKIAGKKSNPQGYDWNGDTCVPGSKKCLWGAVAYYWATCPPSNPATTKPANTCTNPAKINVRIQVTPFPQAQPKKGVKFREFPRNEYFNGKNNATSFATSIHAKDIVNLVQDECAKDQKQTGTYPDGKPICECIVKSVSSKGKFNTDGFGRVKCGPQSCQSKFEVMTGYDGDTGKITCLNLKNCPSAANCPCKKIDLDVSGDCGVGYWMVNIDYGVCKTDTSKNGKGKPRTVSCTGRSGQCCKLDFDQ